MKIKEATLAGTEVLGVDAWFTRGVIHGFLDARFDIRANSAGAEDLLARAFGRPLEIVRPKQIHSVRLLEVPFSETAPEGDACVGDFSLLRMSNLVLGVISADCAPLLFLSRKSLRRAAVHCGWRGTVGGLLERTVQWYSESGEDARDIELAVGPSAGACCYEVRADVLSELTAAEQSGSVAVRDGKTYLHLQELLCIRAKDAGIPAQNIARAPHCTICNERFFSFRKQGASAGRQLSFIGGSY